MLVKNGQEIEQKKEHNYHNMNTLKTNEKEKKREKDCF